MRILLTAILVLTASVAQSQVRWLATEHDFGAFDEDDGKVYADFRFVNDSEAPLRIEQVRSSCGCTVPQFSKTPVNHGDTATVTVAYNPSGRPGRFSKFLKVKLSNDSTETLMIKGVVIGSPNTLRSRYPIVDGPVRLHGDMVTFGAVKSGKIKSQFFEVYNTSREAIAPHWSNLPKYLRVTSVNDTIPPGEKGVYAFVFAPVKSTPYGILTDSLTFNVPGEAPLAIKFAANVEEDFSTMTEKQLADAPVITTDTDMLDFGEFSLTDKPMTLSFRVKNSGKDQLIIRRLHTSEPGVTVKASFSKLKKGKSGTVKVTFDPAQFSGTLLNSRLQVITNDPARPLTTVRLVGIPHNF